MKHTVLKQICVAIVSVGAFTSPAVAETLSQPTTVVELFTSQGCSSCPPANASVVSLDEASPDVLSLSYGVTYWDYLGWEDTFGDPAFTTRQRRYDKALDSGVYTPMLVVGGKSHSSRLAKLGLDDADVPSGLSLMRYSGELCLTGTVPTGTPLALVEYVPGMQTVAVKRGENQGRTLTLANVVTDVKYSDWSGKMICGLHPKSALAVLAHDPSSDIIIGAARYEP